MPSAITVLTEIAIINQLTTSALERVLPHRLSLAQFSLLTHFSRLGGGWAPARLARALQVTKGAMTNTLKKLAAQGFVAISPDPADGRAKIVTLTKAGAAAHADALVMAAPLIVQLTTALGDKKFKKALPFLRQLRTHLDEARS